MKPGSEVSTWELFEDANLKNDLLFNPYDSKNLANNIGDEIENELEHNSIWQDISTFLVNCKYKQLKDSNITKNDQIFTLNLNIRSLHKHIDSLSENILLLQKYDILCFCETNCDVDKLPNGLDSVLLDGFFEPIHQAPYRTTNKGGGLAIYVNKSVCNEDEIKKLKIEIDPPDPNGEFLLIKINNCKNTGKTVIIGNVYRSPSRKTQKFVDLYEEVLQTLDKHKSKHIIISGDFNIDLIKHESDHFSQNLLDAAFKYGFVQTISRPTRVTDRTYTLIDHIYCNMISKVITSSIFTLDITDHLATSLTVSLDPNFDNSLQSNEGAKNTDSITGEFRIINEANSQKFHELITEEHWDLPEGLDAQQQFDEFNKIYISHYNNAFPLKTERVRCKKERLDPKPWILPWLEEASDRKNRLYFVWVKNPTDTNHEKYKKMKKFVDKHVKKAKAKYYEKYFTEHKNNSKKKRISVTKLIDKNGNNIKSPQQISEKFNDYFVNIAENLKSKIS